MPTATFTGDQARAGTQLPLAYAEFFLVPSSGGTTTYRWAKGAIADGSTYGGFKEARILSWSGFSRALSGKTGQLESAGFSIVVSDADGLLRGLMEDSTRQFFLNRQITVKLYSQADRVAGNDPIVVGRGLIRTFRPLPNRQFQFDLEDFITTEFGSLDMNATLPKRRLSASTFANLPTSMAGLPEPIIYGDLNDTGRGAVFPIYLGYYQLPVSGLWYAAFLVAGHAVKSINHLYGAGGQDFDIYMHNGAVLAPGWENTVGGYEDWAYEFGSTLYRDIGGRRYTLIYAEEAFAQAMIDGSFPAYLDVSGIEDVGDGTGTLITDVALQFRHFLTNFVLGDYQSGGWLSIPPFDASLDTTPRIDSTSFTTVSSALASRGVGTYVGGGGVGFEAPVTVKDMLARWAVSADCDLGFNSNGQLAVSTDDSTTAVATFTDKLDVFEFSPPVPQVDRLANVIQYIYKRPHISGDGWAWLGAAVKNQASIDANKTRRADSEVQFYFLRSAAVAENAAAYRLRRVMQIPRVGTLQTALHGLNADLGQVIGVTHFDGTGSAGWSNRKVRVTRVEPDLDSMAVRLTFVDRDAYPAVSYSTESYDTRSGQASYLTPGGNAQTVALAFGYRNLGGGRTITFDRTASWTRVADWVRVSIPWDLFAASFTVQAVVEVRTESAGTSVTPRIYDVTAGAVAVTGVACTATAADYSGTDQVQTLVITRPGGGGTHVYVLELQAGNTAADVFGTGYVEIG